ncbi:MAG: alpha-galactosidase [Armatimonadetes bacterium]|nr:alpha-galactosidase [Armatimonadota bacterium]
MARRERGPHNGPGGQMVAWALGCALMTSGKDWMVDANPPPATFKQVADGFLLENGIVARRWANVPALATVGLENLCSGEEFVRAVRPEAILVIDGKEVPVGGFSGQSDQAFLDPSDLSGYRALPGSFVCVGHKVVPVKERFPWGRRTRGGALAAAWPPEGVGVEFEYRGPQGLEGLSVTVHYEAYRGLPVISKWVTLKNDGKRPVQIDGFKVEVLAAVEAESVVDSQDQWRTPNITVTTDYTFAGMAMGASNRAVRWLADPAYETQVNYEKKTPCLLEVAAPIGPGVTVAPGKGFETFRVFELPHDSTDRERKGLQVRRMFRCLAPWSLENPIMLHLTSSDPSVVRKAIDQAAECGFEMIVISFWSGLDMEDVSPGNISKWKGLVDYAHSKGLEMGGYSLLASRSVGPETDVIDPKTGKPGGAVFGNSPCLGSAWGIEYFRKLRVFIEQTGFDLLEHDGSYPGDVCASTSHPGHKGLADSQWTQFREITDFYHWCRARGVYLNVPDNYFLQGSNKTGMGYRESNWSLPRAQQHIHARQNLYDGTWEKTPSMGWMMVPLVEYQGGGPAATIEPLHEHLADYEMHLANNFGYGAQACYRGPRIYDTPEVKAAVCKWVTWFRTHREVLEADVVHIRRARPGGWDAILHVNPFGKEKAMLVVWNPTDHEVTEDISVSFAYAGLAGKVSLIDQHGHKQSVSLDGPSKGPVRVKVAPQSMSWYVAQD